MKWGVLLFSLVVFEVAEARVFNINDEKVAGYFLATGGPSALQQNAFLNEQSAGTTYSAKVAYNYSGEFGFLYSTPKLSLRFGFEVFKPSTLKQVAATSSGGSEIYSVDSDITAYAPKLGLELNLQSSGIYRSFLQVYAGTASLNYKNTYIVTSGSPADHVVEAKGSGMLYGASLGVESHFTDATTYIFEFGYRQMKADSLKYSKDVTTFSGSKTAGDLVNDVNGEARTLDLTGGYVSLGLRFYL